MVGAFQHELGMGEFRADPFIQFKAVSKSYGEFQVLKDFNLSIAREERVSLIGPSGSGKTTVLRILMALERIDGGEVLVGDQPLWNPQAKSRRLEFLHLRRMRQNIGMVFQQFNLFPHLSVLRNIADPLRIVRKYSVEAASKRSLELLKMVGLDSKANNYPEQLSGGQKQRVAIARALAMEPKILLFDEITSALDPELVEEVLEVLRRLRSSSDITMLFVTHAMSFAHEFSDRVLFLDGGRIVEEGPPDQLFSEPREERTKVFLRKILASGQRLSA